MQKTVSQSRKKLGKRYRQVAASKIKKRYRRLHKSQIRAMR